MVNETRIRVRYAETDQMGVVYHANHIIWFEVGRVELFRQLLGVGYKQIESDDGIYITVVDIRCRYKAPARYDDMILVRTRVSGARESVIQFSYELVRESDGILIAEGETTHVVTDKQFARTKLPANYADAFRAALHPKSSSEALKQSKGVAG